MTVQEAIILGTKLDAMEEGKEKWLDKSVKIVHLLKKGKSEEEVAKELEIDISIVNKMNEELKR